MILGIIADDFTGATDIAGFLVENGMRTIQVSGIPDESMNIDADAVVVSLKSRSCDPQIAIDQSTAVAKWLKEQGCKQFYFKYCSTFDSTEMGNIGPVTDALLKELDSSFTIVCPALPVNGRTVFNGHLFVFEELLSESGMKNHPVTPMTDSNLIHLMDKQSEGKTALVSYKTNEAGSQAIEDKFKALQQAGYQYAVVDAFKDEHLDNIADAIKDMRLVTGGSGLAAGIAKNWTNTDVDLDEAKKVGSPESGKTVVFSGSCSEMTNKQVAKYQILAPHYALDVARCVNDREMYVDEVATWCTSHIDAKYAPLVYATAEPEVLKEIQATYGAQKASTSVEQFFSQLAQTLKENGVKNFIVAGGETSGIVTQSLNVSGFYIGPQIAPGVPWVKSLDGQLSLALKSGNFGNEDFFEIAQGFIYE